MGWNFLYTLGNSDIKLVDCEGNVRKIEKTNFRKETEDLYSAVLNGSLDIIPKKRSEEFEVINSPEICAVSFPIFCSFLNFAIREQAGLPVRVYLFATNQKESQFHGQDTIYLAKLLKEKIIPQKYPPLRDRIEIVEISGGVPASFDDMSEFFMNFVERERSNLESAVVNYVQVTAGTPAMYVALTLAMRGFPIRVYYMLRGKEEESIPIESRFFEKLIFQEYITSLETLINSYSYPEALEILKRSPLRGRLILEKLLEIMKLRRLFDFDGAKREAYAIPESSPELDKLRKKLLNYFSEILESKDARLKASFEEFEIYFKKGEYHSACAALFNFIELLSQIAFEEGTRYKIDEFKKCIEGEQIEIDVKHPSYPNIRKVINTLRERGKIASSPKVELFEKLTEDKLISSMLEKLRGTRNKGPFAHDVKEFPLEQVDYLKQLYDIIRREFDFKVNFYDEMNEFIIRTLKSLI